MAAYSLQEAFRQMLIADAALIALVPAARITSDFSPATTPAEGPWIIIEQISGRRDGDHGGDNAMRQGRFQLEIGSTDPELRLGVHDYISENFNLAEFNDTTQSGHVRKLLTTVEDEGTTWEEPERVFKARLDILVQSEKVS